MAVLLAPYWRRSLALMGQKVSQMWNGRGTPPPPTGTPPGGWGRLSKFLQGHMPLTQAIAQAAAEAGQTIDEIPQSVLYQLRAQAEHALANNTTIDTAAALRKADFESRTAAATRSESRAIRVQFAREQNLRGIARSRRADSGATEWSRLRD